MRKVLLILALLAPSLVAAQGYRFDSQISQEALTSAIAGVTNVLTVPSSAQVAFCNFPANAVPCTNKATTYTSVTLATPCSTSTQIVLTNTSTCVASPDAQQNWGVWVPAGQYSYTITLPVGANLGPYIVNFGIVNPSTIGANISFTGNNTHSGTETFTGPINCTFVNLVECISPSNPQGWAGSDFGAWVNSAVSALPSNGGEIQIASGTYSYATTIVINKNVIFQGAGQQSTTLTWTGTGGTAIQVTGSNLQPSLRDFALNNTGTGAIGIDWDNSLNHAFGEHITIWPTVAFSTASMRFGQTLTIVDITLRDIYTRNSVIGYQIKNVNAHVNFDHVRSIDATSAGVVLGDTASGGTVLSFHCDFCSIENTTAGGGDLVQFQRAEEASFDNTYFETGGGAASFNIPNTAVLARGVVIDHSFLSGSGTSSTFAKVNLSSAGLTINNSFGLGFANNSPLVTNTSAGKLILEGDDLDWTGSTETSTNSGVFSLRGNSTGGGVPTTKVAGTSVPTFSLLKGTGAGNYTSASTTYVVADSANLCLTVTIPVGWKLTVSTSGSIGTATGAVLDNFALTDNAACSTANAGILVEGVSTTTAAGVLQPFALNWVINGDGNAHNIALQYKTSNGADSATILNSSATSLPTIVFQLEPSN